MIQIPLKRIKYKGGQSLIGVLVSLGLFFIFSAAVITLVFSAYDLISYTRARTTARYIATERIELIRNLPYSSVGTIGGIPPGTLDQNLSVVRNGLEYTLKTGVVFVDDPFDGLAPADTLPGDYKRIRVDVSWGGIASSRVSTVTLISDIAPSGTEGSGGTITILVFDANGVPVPQAEVHVEALSINPPVSLDVQTNNNGIITLPGAVPCNSCYRIYTTKEGFSADRTYGTDEVANPSNPHLTVLNQQVSQASFAIDRVVELEIVTLSDTGEEYSPLGSQSVSLRGDKLIGTNTLDEPVYKFEDTVTTDGNGTATVENLEWGNYFIEPSSGSIITVMNPLSPLLLLPNEDRTISMVLASDLDYSLRAAFIDGEDEPIASVSARLLDGGELVASASAGLADEPNWGQVFFRELEPKEYLLEATASGYVPYSSSVNVDGNLFELIPMSTE